MYDVCTEGEKIVVLDLKQENETSCAALYFCIEAEEMRNWFELQMLLDMTFVGCKLFNSYWGARGALR